MRKKKSAYFEIDFIFSSFSIPTTYFLLVSSYLLRLRPESIFSLVFDPKLDMGLKLKIFNIKYVTWVNLGLPSPSRSDFFSKESQYRCTILLFFFFVCFQVADVRPTRERNVAVEREDMEFYLKYFNSTHLTFFARHSIAIETKIESWFAQNLELFSTEAEGFNFLEY